MAELLGLGWHKELKKSHASCWDWAGSWTGSQKRGKKVGLVRDFVVNESQNKIMIVNDYKNDSLFSSMFYLWLR